MESDMATVTVKKEEEEEDDSSQQPAAVEDDCSQQNYLIPGFNMIFIKEEAYDEEEAEESAVKSEPEMWPSNCSTSGRDYATGVGGLNEHSTSPVEKCTESSVAGKKTKLYSCADCSYKTPKFSHLKIKEEIEAFLNAPMDIGRSAHELSLKDELDYENQSKMSTCDQITDSKSPVSEHNSLSGESDSRLTKAIEKEVCGGRIAKVVSVSLEDSFEGCNQQKLCPYQMVTVTVKKEEEKEEEEDSSQQPAAVEDDCSQQHYLIPGYNMIFIKEDAYDDQEAEGSAVKSEPEMWPSNCSTSGRDYATEVGGLNEHSISPVEKCTESSVAGKKTKLYSCADCSYKTPWFSHLKIHIRKHTGEKPFSCDICDYKSARLGHLKEHIKTHTGEKPFSCDMCGYKSARLDTLKEHIKTHTGEKTFSCNICDYKSARLGHLKEHIKTHTGEKPFSCEFCEYKCADPSCLKKHIRTHTGEKPFSCEFCEYKCADPSCLKKHIRTHTGEKPFSCKFCEYKCADSSNLKNHIRTHTGEKPFSC
ncbi:zinc finger protein 771-like isoform X4 [Nilaparvata lugens]|uniref:zinc finger protein 771-like isoform X4 n=1 Tax=Nilaparvata lugens TaxID=108931 RepID=UPI00193D1D89|nr:zinc finger protein 771-like isoform X4 [Nilaparvata lugens]